jgi:L-arabinonolactonase
MVSVRPLLERCHDLSECILWDEQNGVLWWTDIYACHLWCYNPVSGEEKRWNMPSTLGCFALTDAPGVLLLGLSKALARFDTRTEQLDVLVGVEAAFPAHRINDGRCDRAGNFVFGTTTEGVAGGLGGFYRYKAGEVLQRLDLPAPTIANSLCFSPDGATLYFTDSPSRRIMQCDYHAASGSVSNIRLFADVSEGEPDGSTTDAQGYVWNAVWGGHVVIRYAPDGRIDQRVDLVAAQPSCVAFGGPSLDLLYVTSARRGLPHHELNSGRVYEIAGSGALGVQESRFAW